MGTAQIQLRGIWLAGTSVVGMLALALGACGTDEAPQRSSGPSAVGVGGSDAGVGGGGGAGGDVPCVAGDVRDCKVQINEKNCFVGEQECVAGEWGPCVEAGTLSSNGFKSKAISTPTGCTNNPCNPECQEYDEDPAMDLTASGSPPPPVAGGTIGDLPSSWANACLQDTAHACASPCTSSGFCQFDTFCDTPPGNLCTPWGADEFETGAGDPNFTIGVACDPSTIQVCNRGDVAGGMGVGISTWTPNTNLCGGSCGTQPLATGQSGVATQQGSCTIPTDIDPGKCIAVDCSSAISGQAMLHVNGCDQFACVAESDASDNYGIYDPSVGCTCASTTAAASLERVNMFLLMDDSGSMNDDVDGMTRWEHMRAAFISFVQNPLADDIYLASKFYEDCTSFGSLDCETADVGDPQSLRLDNATTENLFITDINGRTAGGHGGTKHDLGLNGAAEWAKNYSDGVNGGAEVIVYITDGDVGSGYDGEPNLAQAQTVAQPIADAAMSHQVVTYGVALPGATTELLTEVASAGGTSLIDLRMSMDVGGDLADELTGIAQSTLSCTITIPNASTIDPNMTTIEYTPTSGPAVTLMRVADAATCSGGDEFYFLPDGVNPTEVVLCDTICATIRTDVGSSVSLAGGCAGSFSPAAHVFDYFGDCTGYPPSHGPVWELLSYDTTVPGDASVVWEISTSNVDAADAAMGPWTQVATSTPSAPDAPGSAPILLGPILEGLAQQNYVALRITVNPTTGGGSSATVHDWNLKYTCAANQ